jgi:hypothetical protein
MDYLFQDGGKPKKVSRPKSKGSETTKTTKSKKKVKKLKNGGNFLGSVGELVAPTGWEGFVTTAGLFALDRADSFLRKRNQKKKISGGALIPVSDTTGIKRELTDKLMGKQPNGPDDPLIWIYAGNGSRLLYVPKDKIVHLFYKDGLYSASSNVRAPIYYKNKKDNFVESTNGQRQILTTYDEKNFFNKLLNKTYMNSII